MTRIGPGGIWTAFVVTDLSGFEWDDADHSTYSFVRRSSSGYPNLLFVLNMTPVTWENYKVKVPGEGKYWLKLNSDEQRFGGGGNWVPGELHAFWDHEYGHFSVCLNLPPYAACVYLF